MNELQDVPARKDWIPPPGDDYDREHPGWDTADDPTDAPPADDPPKEEKADDAKPAPLDGLADFLSIESWTLRDIPPADRLLGDLVTTTSRMFLVGSTGLGKTLLALGMACGMASGRGFLHWQSERAARVLYVDGEMPAELIKARSIDALRRLGSNQPEGRLFIYARDSAEEFAKMFPSLKGFAPLNTKEGQDFILELIGALGGIDAVVFDNVMSLVAGDQKDEIPWTETLPLVAELTSMKVAQVWADHTGHNKDRQYGSSTKAWRFDAVGLMAALPDDQKQKHEVAFTLSFESPGKARRRTPDNWRDFEPRIIRLREDEWFSTSCTEPNLEREEVNLSRAARAFHSALMDTLAVALIPGKTTRLEWHAECARLGLLAPLDPKDTSTAKDKKMVKLRKYISEFKIAGLIGVNGDEITYLHRT